MTFKVVSREDNNCIPEMKLNENRKKTYLPTSLSRYELKDIFNINEFSIFLPNSPGKKVSL